MIIGIIGAIILVAIDQITKYMALTKLRPIGNITFIDGVMDFTFVKNHGAAFGILNGKTWLLLILAVGICFALIYSMIKMPDKKEYKWLKATLWLIVAGAVGNVIDRLFRGYVVDFLEFTFISWPVFNVADIYVVVGTILMALLVLFVIKEEDNKNAEQ